MEFIEWLKVVLLGIVEGITEWLPISSTGHMILVNEIFPLKADADFMNVFEVVIQLGAILAVVVIYFWDLWPFHTKAKRREKSYFANPSDVPALAKFQNFADNYFYMNKIVMWLKIAVSCLPAAVIGLLFNDWIEAHLMNYVVVALTLIIYGIMGNVSITSLFTAGFIPGFMVAFCMSMTAWLIARRQGFSGDSEQPPFNLALFLKTCARNSMSLLTPIIILGSIYSGICTPVEASVVAVIWAFFVGGVVNRQLTWRKIYESFLDGAMLCGVVLLIVGSSTLFGKLLTYEQVPLRLAQMFLAFSQSKVVIILLILVMLLILGMFLETLATLIILVPVLMPVVTQLGIDPVHFGIFLVLTNEVALLSPPLGVNLFVSSRIADIPVESVVVGILPYIGVLIVCTLIVAFIPEVSLFLPRLFGY